MPPKNVVILEKKDNPWIPFLQQVFEDTSSQPQFFHETSTASYGLDKKPDIVFAGSSLLSPSLSQKFKVLRQSSSQSRLFHLGPLTKPFHELPFDDFFEEPHNLVSFQKRFVQHLPLPEKIRVLVDEKDPGESGVYYGRTERDAPEVDGQVTVHSEGELRPGDFVNAHIIDALEYDLVADY